MKRKANARVVLRKQAGKDAKAILAKVEKMLKAGVPHPKIEKALAAEVHSRFLKGIKRSRIVIVI